MKSIFRDSRSAKSAISTSAAQFIVFREKQKMVRRDFSRKIAHEKVREKLAKNDQNWLQFDVKYLYHFFSNC